MRLCLAQYQSTGGVEANILRHRDLVRQAATRSCDLILFPELSLTGYRPSAAGREARQANDSTFAALQAESQDLGVAVCAGMPLRIADGVAIGMLVYQPGHAPAIYAKRMLHADEQPYFVPGDLNHDIAIDGHLIAPAICYEAMQSVHGEAAIARGATVYAASVAKHADGVETARSYLAAFAARHGVPTVLVNAFGPVEGFVCAGRSAAWSSTGHLLGELGAGEGLLFVDI